MLREDLDRIESVPMLPELVGRVLAMMDDPNVTAYQLANVVSKDQSLVSSILKIVNSAYYGFLWRISSVSQAVVLLGFRTIRNLALASTVMSSLSGESQTRSFDRRVHWRHSIATAAATTVLAKRWKKAQPEEAFLAGLVHDIGRVILDQHFPEEFDKVVTLAMAEQLSLTEAEERIFGLTHADIGRHVAQKWQFPDNIVAAIGDHHGPRGDGGWANLAALVHTGDVIARWSGLAVGEWQPELDAAALNALGRNAEEVQELVEPALEEYRRANVFEGLIA